MVPQAGNAASGLLAHSPCGDLCGNTPSRVPDTPLRFLQNPPSQMRPPGEAGWRRAESEAAPPPVCWGTKMVLMNGKL